MPPQPLQRLTDGLDDDFGFGAHSFLLQLADFPYLMAPSAMLSRLVSQAQILVDGPKQGEHIGGPE